MAVEKRIFLVGCPRSGTTLLQSLVAAHPDVISFPESHFFRHLIAKRGSRRKKWGLASRHARLRFNEFLAEVGHKELSAHLPRFAFFVDQYTHAFVKVLDAIAERNQKGTWLEKTPDNLHYLDYIEDTVKDTKFIHIIRNGADVIASLYEVSHKYSEWTQPWSIDYCIERWVRDLKLSLSYQDHPHHRLIRYEELVGDPKAIIQGICQFIELSFNEAMLQDYGSSSKQVSLATEPWKVSVSNKIKSQNSKKFHTVFTEDERAYILNRLRHENIDGFYEYTPSSMSNSHPT